MRSGNFIDECNLMEIYDVDTWFERIREGYVGVQSGNDRRIYFTKRSPESKVYAITTSYRSTLVSEYDEFDEYTHDKLYRILDRSVRRYWVFNPRYLKLQHLKERVILLQGRKSELHQKAENERKFDVGLL